MDRISDSGSDGCGSIPHGGTEKRGQKPSFLFSTFLQICYQYSDNPEYVDDFVIRE